MEDDNLNSTPDVQDSSSDFQGDDSIQENSQNSDFSIPEEYQNKGWTKFFDGKTGDELKAELFKSYDNSQSMIGKRVQDYLANTDLKQLPNYEEIKNNLASQLTPEYQTPQEASEYGLSEIIKEQLGDDALYHEESINDFANTFKEIGITTDQGKKLMKTYVDYQVKEFQKFTDADELENNINEMFRGNQQQRTTCESLIKEFLPAKDQQFIQDTMPNVVVEMFYKVAKGLVDKYDYKENSQAQNKSTMRMSNEDRDNEYNRIVAEIEAMSSRPHSAEEKQKLLSQLNSLYK